MLSKEYIPINMKRWLTSKVGQSWDEIYSEITSKATKYKDRSRIEDQVRWLVDFNVTKHENGMYNSQRRMVLDFYVYNGVLYKVKDQPRYHRQTNDEWRARRGIYWIQGKVVALIDNIWYELILEKRNSPLDRDYFSQADPDLLYGNKEYICIGKKQLNKTEIKQLGLKG